MAEPPLPFSAVSEKAYVRRPQYSAVHHQNYFELAGWGESLQYCKSCSTKVRVKNLAEVAKALW